MLVNIITVGDELLIGQVIDTNSAWIARELNLIGGRLGSRISVGDTHADIMRALDRAVWDADVVLITGGLGPTRDDITKKALADFLGDGFVFSQETYSRIETLMTKLGRPVSEGHRQQCLMPQSAVLLTNNMGTAPGMWMESNGRILIAMPGVPYEMQDIMTHEVLPRLAKRFPLPELLHHTFHTAGEAETVIADKLEAFEDALPEGFKLAYLPGIGQVRVRLSGRDVSRVEFEAKLNELEVLLGHWIYGSNGDTLAASLGRLLQQRGLKMATAESCTGGHIAHLVTTEPGASAHFLGGVVAYSNALKTQLLGVSESTLAAHGAVSEETVLDMVRGVQQLTGAKAALAISGIAGPDGGSEEKPVGTIWLAVAVGEHTRTHKLQLFRDRLKNIQYSSVFVLELLRREILKNSDSR
jgi:nicotinamide-nucleotide amidase